MTQAPPRGAPAFHTCRRHDCSALLGPRSTTTAGDTPACVTAAFTVAVMVGSAVPLTQSASRFQKPQPPTLCRAYPLCA